MSHNAKQLYYLFPGQGRDKRKRFLQLTAAFVVGLISAGLVAEVGYLFYVFGP